MSAFTIICGGGSTEIFFVCWRRFILWSVFRIIKLVDPPCQVHPYVIPTRLLDKVAASWCLGALFFHPVPSCEQFPCVQKYFLAKSGKGLWCCPCLGSVAAWRVRVLQLLVCTPPPVWFFYTQISSFCICWMLVSIWGSILDTSVATLATGVGWMVGTMVGAGFCVGAYSDSWGR